MSKINSVTFPHQDENNWLMIDVGGQKTVQYPSPLEVKMMIEADRQAFEEATVEALEVLCFKYELPYEGQKDERMEHDWQQRVIAINEAIATVRAIYQGNNK